MEHVETLEVKQERGTPSKVEVYLDNKSIRFVTDQNMNSRSGRALEVEKVCKKYAQARGYDMGNQAEKRYEGWWELTGRYSLSTHQHYHEWKLREEINNHPTFQRARDAVDRRQREINQEYGAARQLLKNLEIELERKQQALLEELKEELVAVQNLVAQEIGLPDVFDQAEAIDPMTLKLFPGLAEMSKHKFQPYCLTHPISKIEVERYNNFGQGDHGRGDAKFPTDLTGILALLD